MFDPDATIWKNGSFMQLADGGVSPLTHSLHYGSGAFEGIRAYETSDGQTQIFRLPEHIDRLFYSAASVFLSIPYTKQELIDACMEVVRANTLKAAYIRPLAYHDASSLGVATAQNDTEVMIAALPWGQYLADSVSVILSPYKRISEQSLIADAKISGHYVNSLLATTYAKERGYHEALLLDHTDNIAEGPGENVFFVKGSELHTPKLGKILKGITRDCVLKFAADLGYTVHERDIPLAALTEFDAAFFTGTAAEITPIERIDTDDATLRTFDLDASNRFKTHFFDIVLGNNQQYANWLSYVKK